MTNGDDLDDFYSDLNQKLIIQRQTKRHLDRFLSPDFNVFTCIKPDEKRLSNVIANLLNPASSHGQQGVFLDAFLRRIGKDDLCDKQSTQVATEYRIENPEGYIDVLVDFGVFGIAIENKPWAKETNEQISKYSDYLNKKYKGRFCLVYLTQDGRQPTSIEENKCSELIQNHKLLLRSYRRDILEWLRECCQLCESDKVRGFLFDFMNYIPTMEGSMSNSSERKNIGESKMILEHALASEKNLKTTLDIGLAFSDLKEKIIHDFLDKLEKFVLEKLQEDPSQYPNASEWIVTCESLRHSPLEKYKKFMFGKDMWKNQYGVALEPQGDDACGVILGVWRESDETKNIGPRFRQEDLSKLNNIRSGKTTNCYEWHYYLDLPYPNWNTKEALIKLHDGEAVEPIGKELVEIIKVAEPIIDKHVRGS